MGNTSPEERREAIIQRAIEVHEPYKVFKQSKDLGFKSKGFCILYTSPKDQTRHKVMEDIADKATARDIKNLIQRAWAEGYYAAAHKNELV